MTISALIVLGLRLLIPISIFRYRIIGAIASMVIDMLDVVLVDMLQSQLGEPQVGFGDYYQRFDKWLDIYYLTFEAIVCFSWPNRLARNAALSLFMLRLIGIGAFEITGEEFRKLIFFFPNLFENFFIYYIICERFAPKFIPTTKTSLVTILAILYIPKFAQEYILHFAEVKPWQWIRTNIL